MLFLNKHNSINNNLIVISLFILKKIKKVRVEDYSKLKGSVITRYGTNGEYLFIYCLNFLFLLGLIDFHKISDNIEYTGDKNSEDI